MFLGRQVFLWFFLKDQRSGGGGGCNIFVPVLGGNGTKITSIGDKFDQPPGQMR